MDLFPFDVPHIMDAIVCSLTIANLYCVVVWSYSHYFHSPVGRQTLPKHSRHMQTLACDNQAILSLLVEAGCTHLLEINSIIDDSYRCHSPEYVPTDDQGLMDQKAMVALNTRLRAVSIEDFHIGAMREARELADVMDFLEHN
ncbi:hypothetical protein BGZ93_003271 [Podila epicladia]|nr:hypothetical protein BGZ92_000748 [Podila epicladia]KAG0097187.1 hypothetical protein BGZ93_003271 [Podila epicladia]